MKSFSPELFTESALIAIHISEFGLSACDIRAGPREDPLLPRDLHVLHRGRVLLRSRLQLGHEQTSLAARQLNLHLCLLRLLVRMNYRPVKLTKRSIGFFKKVLLPIQLPKGADQLRVHWRRLAAVRQGGAAQVRRGVGPRQADEQGARGEELPLGRGQGAHGAAGHVRPRRGLPRSQREVKSMTDETNVLP